MNIRFGAYNDPCFEVVSQQVAWVRASVDIARELGASIVTTSLGEEYEWQDRREGLKVALPLVRECAAYARERAVVFALEMPHKHTLAKNLAESVEVLDILSDLEGVGVTLDTSQVVYGDDSVTDAVDRLGRMIAHVHLRDARGKYTRLAPGKGEVNFKAFFENIKRIGYAGVYSIEFEVDEFSSTDIELTKRGLREAKRSLEANLPPS
jgi:sugar phosphate isomerase/epimerase